MSFTKNYRALEKNFCILMKQYKGFLENEIYLPDEENRNDLNPFKSNNQLKSNSSKNLIEKEKINGKEMIEIINAVKPQALGGKT